jgi:ABC-type transport system substrate-binding protein
MAIDRDLWIDTVYNVSKFQSQGLPVETRWNSTVLPAANYYGWLDPRGKDFGPNSKYLQHDIAEAKKLMMAAGYSSGIDLNYYVSVNFDTNQNQIIEGMVPDVGIRLKKVPLQYATEFIPKYRDVKGNFEGMSHNPSVTIAYDSIAFLALLNYSKGGLSFNGFDSAGKGDQSGDSSVDMQIEKSIGELDQQKRIAIVNDLQRYMAGKMYDLLFPGSASGFSLAWPALGNFLALGGDGPRRNDQMHHWLDQTKPPFAKA